MYQFLAQFSIRAKIFGLILLGIAAALIIGVNGITGTSSMYQLTADMHDNMLKPVYLLGQARKFALYISRGDYRYIAETEKSVMDKVLADRNKYIAEMTSRLDQYRKTDLTPPELEALKRFDAAWPAMEAPCKKVRELSYTDTGNGENNKKALDLMRTECRPKFQEVDAILTELSDINIKLADKALEDAQAQYHAVRTMAISVLVVGLVILIVLGLMVQNGIIASLAEAGAAMDKIGGGDLTGRIEPRGKDEIAKMMHSLADTQQRLRSAVGEIIRSAGTVAATSEELAASTEQVSASIGQQVNATSSAAASIEELTVSIDLCASNAAEANQQAVDAGQQAKAGNKEVQESTVRVRKVNDSVSHSADSLESLSDQAQQIGSIATVIKDVADQTNLLALNAAIEAARAGEQGRGFAVVADEVRKLAERTTTSAQEITNMIGKIQDGARLAVDGMRSSRQIVADVVTAAESASGTIGTVEERAAGVMSAISEIALAVGEQRQASTELAGRVEAIANMSKENGIAVDVFSQATRELAMVAEKLQQTTLAFRLE
ncbi:methyl-accepting chemotaxis protein [Chromobacterium sp. IIBBL 290-4]|uniref:methyl-accepting chemotaxis protein n=1 Tax=Chromobacterium sp. IIBBL 290-4 TaxID=2953890 RepID=UPI0020B731C4|nr:methyl-accepting chemotaxis protein [Chromobacterium sp. IIBBL 290-4]UTH74684.1 methyl-accepting chemotaxis protein [Chromobacterium sp. IIBBL 290-4]